jgi:hypothetical protein
MIASDLDELHQHESERACVRNANTKDRRAWTCQVPGVCRELFTGKTKLLEEEDEAVQREEYGASCDVRVEERQLIPANATTPSYVDEHISGVSCASFAAAHAQVVDLLRRRQYRGGVVSSVRKRVLMKEDARMGR